MDVEPLAPETVVALVNGWGSTPRAEGARVDWPAESDLPDWAPVDSAELQRIADLLFPIFATAATADRADQLAELLSRTEVLPTVRTEGESVAATWTVKKPQNALPAAAALALRQQLAEHDPARVGTCAADGCADVYIDVSARAHRRFCSVTCQNRTRVAAFRRRTK
ncbi:CGNR zinc finger domain-containing protein [Kribbella sp. CA-253562]|uniref:CGNR zinc finger domain-containing protein n=1 Tax=Kribbella sp. CA-253562 TaxID=3239942 RepID=UPI003D942E6A